MRKVASLVAGGLVALGSIVVGTDRASAHQWDNYSYYYCSKHRQNSAFTVVHSWPDELQPNYIRYWCQEDFYGVRFEYYVYVDMPLDSDNSTLGPSGHDKCWPASGWQVYCNHP